MEKHGADPAPRPVGPEPGTAGWIDGAPGQRPPETLADLGEWELIRRLGAFAPPGQFADDAALVAEASGGSALVVNTDVLVEGIHFSDATTAAADVGWRAAAANLSDLAAMGAAEVVGITVGLVAPASTPWSWVDGVYGGLRQALDAYGGVLLGGDCSGGTQRLLAITAIGRLAEPHQPAQAASVRDKSAKAGVLQPPQAGRTGEREGIAPLEPTRQAAGQGIGPMQTIRGGDVEALEGIQPLQLTQPAEPTPAAPGLAPGSPPQPLPGSQTALTAGSGPIRRRDGRPGDQLVCSGPHGLSRLGLALLQGEIAASEIDPTLVQRAIRAHQRPRPRFDAVRALIACRPAAETWRVGGCDSSDGLAAAVGAIAGASGCAARLNRAGLPLDPAMAALPEAQAWCLGGGEDFELVLALEPAWAEALLAALPGSTPIGELVAGEAGALGWTSGEAWKQDEGRSAVFSGYSHFS